MVKINSLLEIENEFIKIVSTPLTKDIMELDTDLDKMEKLLHTLSIMLHTLSNNRDYIIKLICENEQAKNVFFKVSLLWITLQSCNTETNNYDTRNDYSVSICNIISREKEFIELFNDYMLFIPDINDGLHFKSILKRAKYYGYTPEQIIVLYMNNEDRFLQQIFSGMIFKFIKECKDETLSKILDKLVSKDIISDNFYNIP